MQKKDLSYIPQDFDSVRLRLASPDKILEWSSGEVTRAETINYRTQKPEHDGLFCEKVFGPVKDWECHCGKYRRIRYKGIICDRCGVEVTRSNVRRHRMGHIKLVTPVTHIWFLRGGGSSRIAMVLGLSVNQMERVVYFADYIVTKVNEEARAQAFKDMESEFKRKRKTLDNEKSEDKKDKIKALEDAYDIARNELNEIQRLKVISEADYRELSMKYGQVFEAGMGAESIKYLLESIDLKKLQVKILKDLEGKHTEAPRKKLLRRLMLVESLLKSAVRPDWMCLNVIPVIPPDLRPMVPLDGGRYATSDLNDLYRRVINRNNRLKKLMDLGAPEVITRNEKRMLQEAVDSLMDNQARKGQAVQASTGQMRLLKSLADNLKGKQGRFRQNLLGKRVDYSGRSVIVAGPELRLDECGIPKTMALELFKPFVINKLIDRGKAHNVRSASRYIETGADEVWAVLEEVIKKKFVLLNRAPTLHRLGIQAFRPKLVEDKAVHLHPLVCPAYNADFDGDQMAVHVPLTKMAVKEAETLMLASTNLLKPSSGQPIVGPSKEMILGCYYLTKISEEEEKREKGLKMFSDVTEARMAFDIDGIKLQEKIKVRIDGELYDTTVGRIMFNEVFPDDYPFKNETFPKKRVSREIKRVLDEYGEKEVVKMVDAIKDLSYEYATISGNSMAISDLVSPVDRPKIIEAAEKKVAEVEKLHEEGFLTRDERYTKLIEIWTETKAELDKVVKETYPKNNPLFDQVDSETQGWPVMSLLVGMKGLVANTAGRLIDLPIKDNFKGGYNVLDFLTSTNGTRKGFADTALKTSSSGYLTRRMVDVCQEVVITEHDCADEEGLAVHLDDAEDGEERFAANTEGMVALNDIKKGSNVIVKSGDIITTEKVEQIIEAGIKEVKIRSVLTCKTRYGVCQKCYGTDLGSNKLIELGQAVGIIAAQSLGEPGTQLTMRTRHMGMGKQKAGKDIVQGLPRIDEIMEARNPKNQSLIASLAGRVKISDSKDSKDIKIIEIVSDDKKNSEKYEVDEDEILLVEDGDLVAPGTKITEGSINLKDLFKEAGFDQTASYIIDEVQKIYGAQGEVISGKHIGVLVRQMFSRYKVAEPGETELVAGDTVTADRLADANDLAKSLRKQEAKAERQLLGISAASLATDSFLAAASFMETSKVLINASVTGTEDHLKGLKENVIIGKLIPAGTGFRPGSN